MNTQNFDKTNVDPALNLQAIVEQTNPILHNLENTSNSALLSAISNLTEGLKTVGSFRGQIEYLGKYFPYFQILKNYRKLIRAELIKRASL
jgi:hypothetical protein